MQIPFLHRKSPTKRSLIAVGSIAFGMAGGLLECLALMRSRRQVRKHAQRRTLQRQH